LLNSSSSVALLIEANGFLQDWNRYFIREFNDRHLANGYFPRKGRYVTPVWVGSTPREVLDRLALSFPMVGEKIAFGPHGLFFGNGDAQSHFLAFHSAHFSGANYLFSLRSPKASLVSLRRLFPRASASQLLFGWLRSLETLISGTFLFPHSVLLPLEWISAEVVNSIFCALQIRGHFAPNWFSAPRIASPDPDLAKLGLTEELAAHLARDSVDYVADCEALYSSVTSTIDRENLRLRDDVMPEHFDRVVIPKVRELRGELRGVTSDTNIAACIIDGEFRHISDLGAQGIGRAISECIRSSVFDELSANGFTGVDDLLGPAWVANGVRISKATSGYVLTANPRAGGPKHFGQYIAMETTRIATFRVTVEESPCRNVMLQIGDDQGYVNAAFDVRSREVRSLTHQGLARAMAARIVPTPDGALQLFLSGFVPGLRAWAWLYLLSPSGAVEYVAPDEYDLQFRDPFVSYRRSEAGVES
jgi:hypothetical protein